MRKLDQEVAKFKMELEADNAGITEILERRMFVSQSTPYSASFLFVVIVLLLFLHRFRFLFKINITNNIKSQPINVTVIYPSKYIFSKCNDNISK